MDCRKGLIKQVQIRVAIQRKRRDIIIRQSRSDIAQLLQDAQFHRAVAMVEQLYKDQSLILVHDRINQFCECILMNISSVSSQRSVDLLADDVKEAVSSLIFAASRCGELQELHSLRSFFRDCYGSDFESLSVQLLPGNTVNPEIRQNLCMKHVTDEVKLLLIQEIGREFTLYLEFQESEQLLNSQQKEECDKLSIEICNRGAARAEVKCPEIQDYSCDIGDKWKHCSEIRRSKRGSKRYVREYGDLQRIPSLPVFDYFSSLRSNRRKKTAVQLESQDSLSDGTSVDSVPRNELNYSNLNDVAEKSKKRQGCDKEDVPQILVSKGSTEEVHSCHSRNNNGKPFEKYGHISDNLTAGRPNSQKNSHCFGHVHPKLPEYESVVAKLMGIKREHRWSKSLLSN